MQEIKSIAIIGSGNVATRLGIELKKRDFEILSVYDRNAENAKLLAKQLDCSYTNTLNELPENADLFLFCVSDSAIIEILALFPHKHKLVAHTAGSMPISIFEGEYLHYGVFYPLQTLSKSIDISFKNIPILLEASDPHVLLRLTTLAKNISNTTEELTSKKREKLHLAAIFANNFSNFMYAAAFQICKRNEVDFAHLLPIIAETARKITLITPQQAQTGPAIRFDNNVIQHHIELLSFNSELQNLYQEISHLIYKLKNEDEAEEL